MDQHYIKLLIFYIKKNDHVAQLPFAFALNVILNLSTISEQALKIWWTNQNSKQLQAWCQARENQWK